MEQVTTRTIDLPIDGMTCAGCAARIGRGLSELDGVADAQVNFATERATTVSYTHLTLPTKA